jgi:hypothetical protein
MTQENQRIKARTFEWGEALYLLKPLNIPIPVFLHNALKRIAGKAGKSVSGYVRDLVAEDLAKKDKLCRRRWEEVKEVRHGGTE